MLGSRFKATILIVCCMLSLSLPAGSGSTSGYGHQIQRAVDYLVSHFDPEVGLIYESEDHGVHWLRKTSFPDYHWRYNQTFWIYSDNLFAAYALEPFAPEVSRKIKDTIEIYNVPPSNHFEAAIGQPVGPDSQAQNIIIDKTADYAVLIRIHNGTIGDPRYKYADSVIYDALSKYYRGEVSEAQRLVREVHEMWNGTCLADYGVHDKLKPGDAPSDIGFGLNFKLALLIYGAKVTDTDLPDLDKLEEVLWSKQQANGGITTLSTGHGEPIGSANAETTAVTLLIYNEPLIAYLSAIGVDEPLSLAPINIATAMVLVMVSIRLLKRRSRWASSTRIGVGLQRHS